MYALILYIGLFFEVAAFGANTDPLIQLENTVETVNRKHVSPDLDSFVQALPREWREHFTFVYKSKSIQGASYENPRAVAYSANGNVVLTFNGRADQLGYNRLELAIVREPSGAVEFRDVSFCEDTQLCKAVLSEANPRKCVTCHGRGPHYIWDAYDSWPGVYGSEADVLSLGAPGEAEHFHRFRGELANLKRYRQLIVPEKSQHAFPYRLHEEPGFRIDERPNFHLTMVLLRQQAKFLARKILSLDDRVALNFMNELAFCNEGIDQDTTFHRIREFAKSINLPFEEHWSMKVGRRDLTTKEVLEYSDGLMTFSGLIVSNLARGSKELTALIRGKAMYYSDVYSLPNYSDDLEQPTLRTKNILAHLDVLGPVYPNLTAYNALGKNIPSEWLVNKERFCSLLKTTKLRR